jgi:aminoglycoside phosphotransferase (APT) family kinase protein
LEKLQRRAALLRRAAPLLAEQVDALVAKIEPLVLDLGVASPTLIHGDFKPSQLLIDGNRVAIVDFDRACLGDPALDVGNFMAQFNKSALRTGRDYFRKLSEYFLARYQAQGQHSGLGERARLFQVMSLVRMAVRKFESSPHTYAQKGTSSVHFSLLKEAAECLNRL